MALTWEFQSRTRYGIVEFELRLISIERSSWFLTGGKIYSLVYIIKSVHVMSRILPLVQYWFINNYID